MSLSKNSEKMMEKILKYYPLPSNQPQKQNIENDHTLKKPNQHLHDYRKQRQIYDKSTAQKLENIAYFKQQGNNHYKNTNYREALYFYDKAIIYGDYTFPDKQSQTLKMNEILQQTHCNKAICLIKMGEWNLSKTHLNQAIKGQNHKIKSKGMYWLCKYCLNKLQFNEAKELIQKISALGKQFSQNILELKRQLTQSMTRYEKESQNIYENMFKQ